MAQPYSERIQMEAEPTSTLTPERLLLAAVLGQAVKDLHSANGALAGDAAVWIASPACDDICQLLGYSAEPVRRFTARPRGTKKTV